MNTVLNRLEIFFGIGTPSHKIYLIKLPLFTNFHALCHKIIRDLYFWANRLDYKQYHLSDILRGAFCPRSHISNFLRSVVL